MSAETLQQLTARLARETQEAYRASPFSNLSRYYFSRFSRDSQAVPEADEVAIDGDWQIVLPEDASPLTRRMADHLVEFLEEAWICCSRSAFALVLWRTRAPGY
jgi:hypothetical protein